MPTATTSSPGAAPKSTSCGSTGAPWGPCTTRTTGRSNAPSGTHATIPREPSDSSTASPGGNGATTWRNIATRSGSCAAPAPSSTIRTPSWTGDAGRYGRSLVTASYTSATDAMRAKCGMSSPARRSGYPSPSQRS
jgi:hypothetical protein